jgi:hypothetical protein
MLAEILPEPLEFLNWGWWLLHVVAIVVVFYIGWAMAKKKMASSADGESPSQ